MKMDTIAAIATGLSNSGIGIVRISGKDAISIADRIYQSKNKKKKLVDVKSHTVHYGYIVDQNEMIDEVLVTVMKGPKSFTAEDTVEINCHGGILVVKKVLETVIKYGARCAEPGEFTKRAFLNGRMDLSQAEAVIDLIQAKNEFALKNSINQLKGSVQKRIKAMREKIIYHIAYIESALDDPEHIDLNGYNQQLLDVIEQLLLEISNIIEVADDGKLLKEGIKTVIVGKPNAGKSSLLNRLVGEEKAIVTDIAGTTRDIIEETIQLHGITLNLLDTAGIRTTEDEVEKIGVERAIRQADNADLIIYVVDSSTPIDESDEYILSILKDKQALILLNKSDLIPLITKKLIEDRTDKKVITISAKENFGIDELENSIKEMFFNNKLTWNDEIYITNVRQKSLIIQAYESLKLVKRSILDEMPEDFYSIDLMEAYESLGKVIGESIEDDLVNQIFSKFCMGK